VLTHFHPESDTERIALSILIREAYLCEKKSPLGSYALLEILSGGAHDIERRLDRPSLSEVFELLEEDSLSRSLLKSIESCGNKGQIFIEENSAEQTHIRLRGRSEFPIISLPEFGTRITLQGCKVLSLDGVIESVSEVHHILESCYESKENVVLLARGMSSEVASVLVQNWRLGNLKVVPITTRTDWTQEIVIRDIAQSFNDSEAIHFREKKLEAVLMKDIEIEKGVIRFESNMNIEDPDSIDVSSVDFHEARKRWHSGRNVTVTLGGDLGDYRGILKDRISTIMRFVQFSKTSGIARLQHSWCPCDSIKVAQESSSSLRQEFSRIKIGVMRDETVVKA